MGSQAGRSALSTFRAARRRRWFRLGLAAGLLGAVAVAGGHGAGWRVVGCLVAASVLVGVSAFLGGGATGGRDIGRWRRGAAGERRTAELLEALPSRRWAVWHDLRVPASRSNIDHVAVGPTGVWVIDTKTTTSEVSAGWRTVRFGRRKLDVGPTVWEAEVLADLLEDGLDGAHGWDAGRPVPVRAVVAVHGEGLRRRGARVSGVRVVPASELVARLCRGPRRLSRGQIDAVSRALEDRFDRLAGR